MNRTPLTLWELACLRWRPWDRYRRQASSHRLNGFTGLT